YERIRLFADMEADLQDAADDFHELTDFYTNQKPAWDRLRRAMAAFAPNRSELEKNNGAARALQRMDEILNAPAPYGMVKEADELISAVEPLNNDLVEKKREEKQQEIDHYIESVKSELDRAKAEDDLCNQALYPLQNIKKKLEKETGIPQIAYAVNEAQEAFEKAVEQIEAKTGKEKSGGPAKNTKTVNPSAFAEKTYIESEKDVEDFIQRLKKALMEEVSQNTRIRIR
ncbi:MAG: BREX system P-loop protein BrxC, partial [bacterium]